MPAFYFAALIVFSSLFPAPLYAEVKIKSMTLDAEAQKVIWDEQNGKLNIISTGEVFEGEVLPHTCRVCVKEGEVVLEKDGKEVIIGPGEYYDPAEETVQKGQSTYVKVAEGRVAFQDEIQQQGERKALGEPILVDAGYVLLKLDSCHNFQLLSIDEFDAVSGDAQAEALSAPGELPGDQGPPPKTDPDPDPQPCNSPPC